MSQIRHLVLSGFIIWRKMYFLKDNLKKLYFRFLVPSLGSAMVMSTDQQLMLLSDLYKTRRENLLVSTNFLPSG